MPFTIEQDRFESLFAYGTLMPGQRHYPDIAPLVVSARRGEIRGALADCGAYPALVWAEGIVRGCLLELKPQALVIADEIEECTPDGRGLYRRVRTDVMIADGRPSPAWVYVYADPNSLQDLPRAPRVRRRRTPVNSWKPELDETERP